MPQIISPKIASFDQREVFSVSELTRDIKNLLEDSFYQVWVSGEVSNFKRASSGHFYFTLKDETAALSSVMFRQSNQQLKFQIEDGMKLIVHGRVSVYEQRGQYQIILDRAEPSGAGALQLAFEQLKAKLSAEGLFDPAHKQALPTHPQKIGLITSPKGAVVHDMVAVLHRRYPSVDILIHPVRVQGEAAVGEIVAAIDFMDQNKNLDLLILARGGGSLEDLWSFNEEAVVRAIYRARTPIISAIGHETDFTLADLVADCRAPTPSVAGELAVPLRADLLQSVRTARTAHVNAFTRFITSHRRDLIFYTRQLKSPERLLEIARQKIDDYVSALCRAQHAYLKEQTQLLANARLRLTNPQVWIAQEKIRWNEMSKRLHSADPLAILSKGFAVAYRAGSRLPLRAASEVSCGETLDLRLHQGTLKVRVID